MTEARQSTPRQTGAAPQHDTVWVLDDPRAGNAGPAIGIAERLGVPFRRVPLAWGWTAPIATMARAGSLIGLAPSARRSLGAAPAALSLPVQAGPAPGPDLVISAGRRAGAVALWLKARHGSNLVHCLTSELLDRAGPGRRAAAFDLLVVPEHDRPAAAPNVLATLGMPHRISPLLLRQQAAAWHERLAHLPHPRVTLLLGGRRHGSDMPPVLAHALGRRVARIAARQGGAVLASTSRRTGREATEALAAGLGPVLHLLYRWGEPEENPYLGFLSTADIVVVTADSLSMIAEACTTGATVYVALPELAGGRQRRLIASLVEHGHVRLLDDELAMQPHPPLDEAGRVAAEIRRRFAFGEPRPPD